MKDGLAGGQEVVGNDPPVAAPPDRLGAHDRGAPLPTELAHAGKPSPEVAESA